MAHIITVRILVDEPSAERAVSGLSEMLTTAAQPIDPDEDSGGAWIVDWSVGSAQPVNDTLKDSICNGTYAKGDAFDDWVIFSRSEAVASGDGAGFWSNTYGWTTLDLATKFDAHQFHLPHSARMDATCMRAPYGMRGFLASLIESPDNAELDHTPIAFECWAANADHAREQAENAYPACKVLEITQV